MPPTNPFVKAAQVKKFLKVQFWGEKKQGKTRSALSFPGPRSVMDAEKGTLPYADQYEFDVTEVIRWVQLKKPLEYLKATKGGGYSTLIIDQATTLYEDLVNEVAESERNRYGKDMITNAGWGVIKRRWKNFLTILLELPMHVVLCTRAKDEYEEYTDTQTGERKSRKTGSLRSDDEKSTGYLFDFILECRAVPASKGAKEKTDRFEILVHGSRRHELPKGKVIDITGKLAFDEVFGTWYKVLCEGGDIQPTVEADAVDAGGTPAPVPGPIQTPSTPQTAAERKGEIEGFMTSLQAPLHKPGPAVTAEDLKIVFTRAGEVTWPDGTELNAEDAKQIMRGTFGVESSKDLTKPEADFLFEEFGNVLARRARLARRGDGMAFVEPVPPEQPSPSPAAATAVTTPALAAAGSGKERNKF